MMLEMLIGVVVPAYKVGRFLDRTLASVAQQQGAEWHCVIVDDGSPDDGYAIAQRWANKDARFTSITQANGGVSRARNAGASQLPEVDALLFLDGDDTLEPSALARLGEALTKNPQAVGAIAGLNLIDGNDSYLGDAVVKPGLYRLRDVAQINPCGTPSGYLFRRRAFDQTGGYQPRFIYAQDWHLTVLIARQGPLIAIGEQVVNYRRGVGITSTDDGNALGHDEIRQVRHAVYADPTTTTANKRELRKAWRRHNAAKVREALESRSIPRVVGHAGMALAGRPFDLSRARAVRR